VIDSVPADDSNSAGHKLDKFEEEIKKFEGIHKTITPMEPEMLFQGWYKVDIRPMKQALNVWSRSGPMLYQNICLMM
jgi:dynein heavy chain